MGHPTPRAGRPYGFRSHSTGCKRGREMRPLSWSAVCPDRGQRVSQYGRGQWILGQPAISAPSAKSGPLGGGTWMIPLLPVPAPESGSPRDQVSLALEVLSRQKVKFKIEKPESWDTETKNQWFQVRKSWTPRFQTLESLRPHESTATRFFCDTNVPQKP